MLRERSDTVKLKLLNYISAVCFFISSAMLLLVPLVNFENGFTVFAYLLAGAFWLLLFAGAGLQIFLFFKTKRIKARKSLIKHRLVLFAVFLAALIMLFVVVSLLGENSIAVPINLFVLLISIEGFSVICRMEKLL